VSGLVIPHAEQRCITKLLVEEKFGPKEIIRRSNVQHMEEILSYSSVHDSYSKLSEGRKEVSHEQHAHIQPTALPKKLNSVAVVRKRTIPTERPPLVGEVSANLCE
jgi:hypothetical protein